MAAGSQPCRSFFVASLAATNGFGAAKGTSARDNFNADKRDSVKLAGQDGENTARPPMVWALTGDLLAQTMHSRAVIGELETTQPPG